MAAKESNQQKKDHAQLLFTKTELTNKEIGLRVGVSDKTIGTWAKDGMWEYLRKSLLTSKEELLRRLYDILDKVTAEIDESKNGTGTTADADKMIKYTAAIKNLEIKAGVGPLFETGMTFVRFVQKDNLELAKQITNYFDAFIQEQLNTVF